MSCMLACTASSPNNDTDAGTATTGDSDSSSADTGGDPLAGIEHGEGRFHNFDQGIRVCR